MPPRPKHGSINKPSILRMHVNSDYFASMSDFQYLTDFLEPVNLASLSQDEGYRDGQIGKAMQVYEEDLPDIQNASVIIIGCPEYRGEITRPSAINGPDEIRRQF